MAYKMCWIAKDKTFSGVGPILGKVEKEIFCPLSFEQSLKRIKYFNNHHKRAVHYLMEVYFLTTDLPEIRKIHKSFKEALDIHQSPPDESAILAFYNAKGEELPEDPMYISRAELNEMWNDLLNPDPIDSIDSDWDISSEEEDYLEEMARKKEQRKALLFKKF